MNTSRIGAEYENGYKAFLLRRGLHVTRAAASKGIFDLIAYDYDHCWHVQLKSRETSCRAMSVLASDIKICVPTSCKVLVVHGGGEPSIMDEDPRFHFCEHVG